MTERVRERERVKKQNIIILISFYYNSIRLYHRSVNYFNYYTERISLLFFLFRLNGKNNLE